MKYLAVVLALTGLVFIGCSKKELPPNVTAKAPTAKAKTPAAAPVAKDVYAQRCTTCHGPTGLGDGPAGKALNPKPRSFQDAAWQAKVTDEHLRKVIVQGGASVGLSPLMAPNPDLAAHPSTVDGLVKLIRGLKATP
jgi:cytochrome c5